MKTLHTEKVPHIPDYALALKVRRERLGFTQKEIADKMGVSTMGLSYFESGNRRPNVEMLDKWAGVLGAEIWITINDK